MPAIFPTKELEKSKKQGLLDTLLKAVGTNTEQISDFLKEANFAAEAYPPTAELYAAPKVATKFVPKIVEGAKELSPVMGMVVTPRNIDRFKKALQQAYEKLHDIKFKFPLVDPDTLEPGYINKPLGLIDFEKMPENFKRAFSYIKTRYPKQTDKVKFALARIGDNYHAFYSPDENAIILDLLEATDPDTNKVQLIRTLKHELSHTSDLKKYGELINRLYGEPYHSRPNELRARKNELEEVLRYWLLQNEIHPEIFKNNRKRLFNLEKVNKVGTLLEKIIANLPEEEINKIVLNRKGTKYLDSRMTAKSVNTALSMSIDALEPRAFLHSPHFLVPNCNYSKILRLYKKLRDVERLPTTAEEVYTLFK